MIKTKAVAGALLGILVACGGSGDSGTSPTNRKPTLSFTFKPIAVPAGNPVNLTVSAKDDDGDPLTVTWSITRGALTAQNGSKTIMRWATPATVGTDTVTVKASDGTATTTITAEVKVGTLTSVMKGLFKKSESPYILSASGTPPVMVVFDTSVIEPGTELYMSTPGGYIQVEGELDAIGTVDAPITFKSNDRTVDCATGRGWWEGIRTMAPGIVNLEYVQIWFAKYGVRLREASYGTLRDCRIECSATAGVSIEGNGWLQVFDTLIADGVSDGISVGGPNVSSTSTPDSVRVEGCTIQLNGGVGIRMDLDDGAQSAQIFVNHNDIKFNSSHGISLARSVFPQIHYNTFLGNGAETVSNLFLQGGYPGTVIYPTLDATCNFWGTVTTSQADIDLSIRDSLDTSTVKTRVTSCPWLDGSPITGTPSCTCPAP